MLGPHIFGPCFVTLLQMAMMALQSASCSGLALDARYASTLAPVGLVLVSAMTRQSLVAERDSSFHSLPCFCQFIRMARFCGVFLPSLNSCSPTNVNRTIAAGPTILTIGF